MNQSSASLAEMDALVGKLFSDTDKLRMLLSEQSDELFSLDISTADTQNFRLLHAFGRANTRHNIAIDYVFRIAEYAEQLDKQVNGLFQAKRNESSQQGMTPEIGGLKNAD